MRYRQSDVGRVSPARDYARDDWGETHGQGLEACPIAFGRIRFPVMGQTAGVARPCAEHRPGPGATGQEAAPSAFAK